MGAVVALWSCGGLFSVLLLDGAAFCVAGGWSERLSGRFPCLGEQRYVCE